MGRKQIHPYSLQSPTRPIPGLFDIHRNSYTLRTGVVHSYYAKQVGLISDDSPK